MIRCRECGTINDETAGFCGGCGQFLEWTGERIDPATADAAETPAPDAQAEADQQAEAERKAAEAEQHAEAERKAAEAAAAAGG